jgi:hypothetical protein
MSAFKIYLVEESAEFVYRFAAPSISLCFSWGAGIWDM